MNINFSFKKGYVSKVHTILVKSGFGSRFYSLGFLYLLNGILDLASIAAIGVAFSMTSPLSSEMSGSSLDFMKDILGNPITVGFLLLSSNLLRAFVNHQTSYFVMNLHESLSNKVIQVFLNSGTLTTNIVTVLRDSMTDIQNLCLNVVRKLLLSIQAMFTLTAVLLGVFFYPDSTVISAVLLILIGASYISFRSSKEIKSLAPVRQDSLTMRYDSATELLRNKDFIWSNNLIEKSLVEYKGSNQLYSNALARQLFLQSIPKPLIESILGFLILVTFILGLSDDFLSMFGILIFAMYRVMPSFAQLYTSILDFVLYAPVITACDELVLKEIRHQDYARTSKQEPISLNLNNISFSYDDKVVLRDLNFIINAGEKVLVVGGNGSGKSTLLKIILGVLSPTYGQVVVNGSKKELVGVVSLIQQNQLFFNGDLFDNVNPYNSMTSLNMPEITRLCKVLGLVKLLKSRSAICENNKLLVSGGELQRINVLRVLLEDRPLLILDEITSNIDDKSQDIVALILDECKDKTIIMISHDENHVDYFGKVLRLEKIDQ